MGFEEIYGLTMIVFMVIYVIIILAFTYGIIKPSNPSAHYPFIPLTHQHINPLAHQHILLVSIIIPVRNERTHILRLLEEIRTQDFPKNQMEVIVADDFSDDYTMDFAARFVGQHADFPLLLMSSGDVAPGEYGKKRAIERAVKQAKGEILLFTDADTFHEPSWVSSMVAAFAHASQQMVLGPVAFCDAKNLLQKIQTLEFLGLMGTTAGSAWLGYPVMSNGANLAYRRNAFFETGGFSKSLRYGSGDDQFMLGAVRKLYGKGAISFNRDRSAIVTTEPEASLSGFFRQRVRWVSKSPGYRDRAVLITGLVTYVLQVLLLAGYFLGFLFPVLFILSILVWIVKILLEYPMVRIMSRFFGKQELLGYYFIAQLFQLVYVPLVGIMGLILPYRWKGRMGMH